jgi:carbamoyltransferase
MIILGLHFGHDASVSIIKDGEVILCMEVERHKRIKHIIGLEYKDIEQALNDCNLTIEDIDYATLTSTQLVEYIFPEPKELNISIEKLKEHDKYACTLMKELDVPSKKFLESGIGWLRHVLKNLPKHPYQRNVLKKFKDTIEKTENYLPNFERFIDTALWNKRLSLKDIAKTDYSALLNDSVRHGFHYPASLNLKLKKIPAYIFSHHYAHICYSYYQSPYEEAAVLSNDGAGGGEEIKYACGFFAYGYKNKLYPYSPNTLTAGELYDTSAAAIGLDAGKLMGLASYGNPRFYTKAFTGNWFDYDRASPNAWVDHCVQEAKRQGYDLTHFGNREKILEPINVDFAASTQKLAEEIMLEAAATLHASLTTSKKNVKNLCLSGGVALNCPANSRLSNESAFHNIYIPPAIGDMGLSIGSALGLYHNVMGYERKIKKQKPSQAYLGLKSSCDNNLLDEAIKNFKDKIKATKLKNTAKAMADDLTKNKVIALFDGRSEIGPRALCHRSIIANPKHFENWERVNKIKGREPWRPFAPIVLEGEEEKYFYGCPFPSYFMLFNAVVKTDEVPAITHVDRTSRIQSISKDCGIIYNVLQEFKKQGNIPILMNTSFNGPGEPIVETPEHAIGFLLSTNLDAVYFNEYKLERK